MGIGNTPVIAVIFGGVFLLAAVPAQALPVSTEPAATANPGAVSDPLPAAEAQPRYRLVSPAVGTEDPASIEHKTDADFTWQALSQNGPGSGSNPKIGESSGQSYFDFRDGLEHPYYILKLKKQ